MVHTNKYCVGATRGSIELSKGNYLALARKKDHLFKVCQRIICFVKKNKKIGKVTVKCKPKFSKARQQLQGAITYRPHVFTDCEMFWQSVPAPCNAQHDNDCDSEWSDIDACVQELSSRLRKFLAIQPVEQPN